MSDSVRLIEARMILESATVAGLKVYRRGRIEVVGMVREGMADPNVEIVKKMYDYRREIEHLLPREGDSAADLEPLALSGMTLPTLVLPR